MSLTKGKKDISYNEKISKNFNSSLKNFELHMPTKIYFGKGQVEKSLGKEIEKMGVKGVLLAYGGGSIKKIGLYEKVMKILKEKGVKVVELSGIKPNPRIASARKGIELIRKNKLDLILSVGGGSIVDCCKAIARGVFSDVDIWEHFDRKTNEREKKKLVKALPLGVILTLAATGSEMNGGCVLSNHETGEKLVCISDLTKPKFSILDPTLTFSVSKYQTHAGCFDIISHLLEQYFSENSPYLLDRFIEGCIKTIIHYTPKVLKNPNDYESRANIMFCSTMALNDLASCGRKNAGWNVHKIEHEVSAVFPDFTHGIGLAIITIGWMKSPKVLNKETCDKFCILGENVFGLRFDEYSVENARTVIDEFEKFLKDNDFPTKFSEVIKEFSEEHAKKCVENFIKHWGINKESMEILTTNDMTEILVSRI